MNRYEDVLNIIEEICGNKDNVISLATIDTNKSDGIMPIPAVRNVDAYYEKGTFYITTSNLSEKMKQIRQNNNVAFAVNSEWFSGNGIGENLGWVLNPKNMEIRDKLRKVFANWYDMANNENDKNCCILAIHIIRATVIKDHGKIRYNMDFINKKVVD